MKAPAIDDICCFVNIIHECLKELWLEAPPAEELVAPMTPEVKDLEGELYLDKGLEECPSLTPDLIPDTKHPKVELKELPENLRYEFLDIELNRSVIVNANLGR